MVGALPVGLWHWIAFGVLVVVLLTLDLFVFHRHDHTPSLRESFGWTVFWIALGLLFNGLLWWWGVVVGEGDTYEEALTDAASAIAFHIDTFGSQVVISSTSSV